MPDQSVWYDGGQPVNITVFGEGFTAGQTADALTIAIENERPVVWSYRLDGFETLNVVPGPQGPQEIASTVTWSGSQLIITSTFGVENGGESTRGETTRTLTINADGTLLVQAPMGPDGSMLGSVYARRR